MKMDDVIFEMENAKKLATDKMKNELLQRMENLDTTLSEKRKRLNATSTALTAGRMSRLDDLMKKLKEARERFETIQKGMTVNEFNEISAVIATIECSIPSDDDDGDGDDDEERITPPFLIPPKPPKSDSPGIS